MSTKVSIQFVRDALDKHKWTGPVIDLGAGSEAKDYSHLFPTETYFQLDLLPEPTIKNRICANLLNMPQVPSNTYGVVLLLETLEHVANPFLAFKEAARILRHGGLFICTTVHCWPMHKHPKDYWRFLPDGLDFLCASFGLLPYYVFMDTKSAIQPGHCCVAAIKS